MSAPCKATKLYRHYDADGVLLYVGISIGAMRRLIEHLNGSDWSGDIAHVRIETHPTLQAALEAEQIAIQNERPKYNVIHNGKVGLVHRRPRRLTDNGVRKLKPGQVRREVADTDQRGLYIVVHPTGRRSFAVRYTFEGRSRKLTLPKGVSLSEARKMAAEALFEVRSGIDPAAALPQLLPRHPYRTIPSLILKGFLA